MSFKNAMPCYYKPCVPTRQPLLKITHNHEIHRAIISIHIYVKCKYNFPNYATDYQQIWENI